MSDLFLSHAAQWANEAVDAVDWSALNQRSQATFAKVRDPMVALPPSSTYARQAGDVVKGAVNSLLVEPGWELGGALQSIAQGQGTFGDVVDSTMGVAGAVPGGLFAKAPSLAAIFGPVFHGTLRSARPAIRSGGLHVGSEGAAFVTDSAKDAYEFALMKSRTSRDAKVMKGIVDDTDFKTVNARGEIYDPAMMSGIIEKAKAEGYLGVKIRNIQNFEYGEPSTSWAVFDPANVKFSK